MVWPGLFICAVEMVVSNTTELTIVLKSGNKSNKDLPPLGTLK